jgi:GTPase KRas
MVEVFDDALDEITVLKEYYYKSGDGFIMVYDITRRTTFESIEKRIEKIRNFKRRDNLPIILVGNKCDLENNREVTKIEGENLSKKYKNCLFMESSAKTRVNSIEIFDQLIRKGLCFYPFNTERNTKKSNENKKCLLN